MPAEIILASASPRRAELLQQIGIRFRVLPADIDEASKAGESAIDYVQRLAREKAQAGVELARQQNIHLPVLAADTVVEVDNEILAKPGNAEHARRMLAQLSGRCHRVHTAITVRSAEFEASALSSSEVEFAELSVAEIDAYVATREPLDKAGAYAIQGIAAQFIKHLSGSYSGVMGLALYETRKLLKSCESARFSE